MTYTFNFRDIWSQWEYIAEGISLHTCTGLMPYVPSLSAIPGVNPGVYRWRQLSSRSPIGVIREAGVATPEKGEKLLQAIASAVAQALLEKRLWEEPI